MADYQEYLTQYADAIDFATEAHEGQVRKYTGDPYVVHPIAVGWAVYQDPASTRDMVTGAILHDVLEDTPKTMADMIAHGFSQQAVAYVIELTDVFTPDVYMHLNRKKRKKAEAIRMSLTSKGAKLIKRYDISDNTKSIVEHDPGFARIYLEEKAYLLSMIVEEDE